MDNFERHPSIIICVEFVDGKTEYKSEYQSTLCLGEVIRNCCVNLGIDPDTVDGITKNIKVFSKQPNDFTSTGEWQEWCYNPYNRLDKVFSGNEVSLRFKLSSD